MSAFHNNALIGSSNQGYTISRSVRLRNSATGYFTRTAGTPTSQNVWTISMWVKLGNLVASNGAPNGCFFGANQAGNPNESIKWTGPEEGGSSQIYYQSSTSGGTHNLTRFIVNNFRDPSAWYHLVFQKNGSAASGTGCFLAWVNGVAVTFTGGYTGTQGSVPDYINVSGSTFNIGAIGSANSLDAYLAEVNFVDGQALTHTSFGQTNAITGVWQPKKYTGTYGNNGFYVNFSDNSAATAAAIGKDYSGNGNNLTPSGGISVTAGATYDSMLDSPTPYADGGNGRGNYCVLNPVNVSGGGTTTITNGNLATSVGSTTTFGKVLGSIGMSTGKWYWEVTVTAVGGAGNIGIGDGTPPSGSFGLGGVAGEISYQSSGNKYTNNSGTAYGATYTTNDIIGVAYDADAGSITFYKNNASQGAISGFSGTKYAAVGSGGGTNPQYAINFGQQPFTYTPPTGFVALNTQNLPDASIKKGNQYFDATTYTGTGASLAVVNSGAFQPDFVWTKVRNNTYSNHLEDAVRGVGQRLLSDSTVVEATGTNGKLTSFNSNGFTQDGGVEVGASAGTYVAWQWNAGGSTVTNTNGSISAQVRANATAGFSIVTYTGTGSAATVGHGLGVAPSMIIVKRLNSAVNWSVYNANIGNTNYLQLNSTVNSTAQGANNWWNSTNPTSTVFSIGTITDTNASGGTYVAYCFAAVAGYSAFGKYTGNGSADGPFVYLGFRPRWLMIKNITNAQPWIIVDTSRNTYNQAGDYLQANSSAAENGGSAVSTATADDILSNGFKLRNNASSSGYTNGSGDTYIYAAFAENPFKNSLAR